MSTQELPPVGSRVRVTLEATLEHAQHGAVLLKCPSGRSYWIWPGENDAQVEVLAKPIPPEPEGDVLARDKDGSLWQREGRDGDSSWWWCTTTRGFPTPTWDDLYKAHGPLEVYRPEEP